MDEQKQCCKECQALAAQRPADGEQRHSRKTDHIRNTEQKAARRGSKMLQKVTTSRSQKAKQGAPRGRARRLAKRVKKRQHKKKRRENLEVEVDDLQRKSKLQRQTKITGLMGIECGNTRKVRKTKSGKNATATGRH